jgi:hypothetical protein
MPSRRFAGIKWDEMAPTPGGRGLESTETSVPPAVAAAPMRRSGEVQASVTALDLSTNTITLRFDLAPDEDAETWGGPDHEPFESLKIGGVPVTGVRVRQPPTPGSWSLVVQSHDLSACEALRSALRLSGPVSVQGLLKNGRSIFGFWNRETARF